MPLTNTEHLSGGKKTIFQYWPDICCMCLLQCLNGHIRVTYPTSHQSVSSWPPALPRSAPDAHWSPLEARYLRYIRITSTAVIHPLTCEERRAGGRVMCWCYCGREYGRCGCCRVHHRPLPRPLSTPTNSHARSPIRRSKNAISPPPLLTPSHALHELSTMPSPPPTQGTMCNGVWCARTWLLRAG